MAKRDVREYLYKMMKQVAEMKADLADYDQALKDGHITEEQLTDVKADVARLEENYNRCLYIGMLLDLPNKPKKKAKAIKANAAAEAYMDGINASEKAVIDENRCIIKAINDRLKDLTKKEK